VDECQLLHLDAKQDLQAVEGGMGIEGPRAGINVDHLELSPVSELLAIHSRTCIQRFSTALLLY